VGRDTHRLGYERVDADPDVAVLVATMEATAGWDATRRLRAWERDQLRLTAGERLLDVGCGLGEAALALSADLGDGGEVVGIDRSEAMLRVACAQPWPAGCRARLEAGDARSLPEPDGSFDAARCERTLQWLADPAVAVAELVRVLRPGGRLSLIDTDWSTFAIEVGDPRLENMVRASMATEQGRASMAGARLAPLVVAAGGVPVAGIAVTHTWDSWDPEADPAPVGCFSMESLVDDLVASGRLGVADRDGALATIHDAARAGRFSMRLTLHGLVATVPG
jgi:SAM-dependent methyltransferase